MRNILSTGFQGPIMPVNPKYESVAGVLAYPSTDYSNYFVAILEVGLLNYEVYRGYIVFQLALKLIDPENRKVIGRVRNFESPQINADELLANEARGFRGFVAQLGTELGRKGLQDFGVLATREE